MAMLDPTPQQGQYTVADTDPIPQGAYSLNDIGVPVSAMTGIPAVARKAMQYFNGARRPFSQADQPGMGGSADLATMLPHSKTDLAVAAASALPIGKIAGAFGKETAAALEAEAHERLYPPAGDAVDGRTVREHVPNMGSIDSTLDDYDVLPGIREVNMSDFGGPRSVFYAADDFDRSKALAGKIAASNEINPLIIVHDAEGPYILEGAHRYVALHELGAKSFPAKVVIDRDSVPRP